MITVLQYLVIAAAIGLVVFFIAVLVFGRGEELAPLPVRTSPAELPEKGVAGGDVRAVRFAVSVRGYRMSDVDWTLDRLADETDRLRAEVRKLGGDPDDVLDAPLLETPLGEPVDEASDDLSQGGRRGVPQPIGARVTDSGQARSGAVDPGSDPAGRALDPRGTGDDRTGGDPRP